MNELTVAEVPYNPEAIAEKALWPLVDLRWGGDFRIESEPNLPPFSMSAAVMYQDRWFEVTLDAHNEVDEFYEDEGDTEVKVHQALNSINLWVEELRPEQTRIMIDMAVDEGSEEIEDWLGDDETETKEYELRAMVGNRYYFDSDGDFTIEPSVALKNNYREILWGKGAMALDDDPDDEADDSEAAEDTEPGEMPEPSLMDVDVVMIAAAVKALRGSKESIQYLEKIISSPEAQ